MVAERGLSSRNGPYWNWWAVWGSNLRSSPSPQLPQRAGKQLPVVRHVGLKYALTASRVVTQNNWVLAAWCVSRESSLDWTYARWLSRLVRPHVTNLRGRGQQWKSARSQHALPQAMSSHTTRHAGSGPRRRLRSVNQGIGRPLAIALIAWLATGCMHSVLRRASPNPAHPAPSPEVVSTTEPTVAEPLAEKSQGEAKPPNPQPEGRPTAPSARTPGAGGRASRPSTHRDAAAPAHGQSAEAAPAASNLALPPKGTPANPSQAAGTSRVNPAATANVPVTDLLALEQRLRDTRAIGLFTKLSLKNQVDDLLAQFRAYHARRAGVTLSELRQQYDLLLLKVLSLLQDGDPSLAQAISSSREAIWNILADPVKFSSVS